MEIDKAIALSEALAKKMTEEERLLQMAIRESE